MAILKVSIHYLVVKSIQGFKKFSANGQITNKNFFDLFSRKNHPDIMATSSAEAK